GVAVGRRGGGGVGWGGGRGGGHRQGGWRRPGQAESLHRAQERLRRRRTAVRGAAGACEGPRRAMEISALDRYPARPAAHGDGQDPALQAERLMATLARRGWRILP